MKTIIVAESWESLPEPAEDDKRVINRYDTTTYPRWRVIFSRTRIPSLWDRICGRKGSREYLTVRWNGWFSDHNARMWWIDSEEELPSNLKNELAKVCSEKENREKAEKERKTLEQAWKPAPVLPVARLLEDQE